MASPLYDTIGGRYTNYRRPDPRIAGAIRSAIADCPSVVNIGAGSGSYEPTDREVVAVEPSRVMISQRPHAHGPCVQARAEALPFRSDTFDCALAVLTLHHWSDAQRGLAEACRVARRRVVLLTWTGFTRPFWLMDYLPEINAIDTQLFPSSTELDSWLGPNRQVTVPIPHDCTDGFLCAYWRRPEAYLDPGVRSAISTFARISDVDEGLSRLQSDLEAGAWHDRYGELLEEENRDFGYRLIIAEQGAA